MAQCDAAWCDRAMWRIITQPNEWILALCAKDDVMNFSSFHLQEHFAINHASKDLSAEFVSFYNSLMLVSVCKIITWLSCDPSWSVLCIQSHDCHVTHTGSLVPRPRLQKGKGSGKLSMVQYCSFQWANEKSGWMSCDQHVRMWPHKTNTLHGTYLEQIQTMYHKAADSAQTKKSLNFHQALFLSWEQCWESVIYMPCCSSTYALSRYVCAVVTKCHVTDC